MVEIAEEQLTYAKLLDRGMKVGILFLIVSFTLYASGLLAPHVPVAELPKYWGMPVKQYLTATGIHPGWSWVGLVGQGDFSNFIGIAFLSGITIACYLAIIPDLPPQERSHLRRHCHPRGAGPHARCLRPAPVGRPLTARRLTGAAQTPLQGGPVASCNSPW